MANIRKTSALLFLFMVWSLKDLSSAKKYKQVRGVNRSGAEYACVQNNGVFEGPVNEASVQAMKSWNINVVRLPLNEDCWLGINNPPAAYSGENYRRDVAAYVNMLRKNNIKVILDLQWSDGVQGKSKYAATSLKPMPDAASAPSFWKSVASLFKNDDGIIFDLFNEPFPDRVMPPGKVAWQCWKNGANACQSLGFVAAGMQSLVDAVRSTGAKNLIIIGGLNYATDLSRWDEFKPNDPDNNIAPSWHNYKEQFCNSSACWERVLAPLAEKYDLIVSEIGENDCAHAYIDQLMPWLDARGISYLAWTWNTWGCATGPALISNDGGTPTNFGIGLKNHLTKTR